MCKNVKSRKPIFAKSKRAKSAPHKDNTTPEHVQRSMAADSKKKEKRAEVRQAMLPKPHFTKMEFVQNSTLSPHPDSGHTKVKSVAENILVLL